MKIDFKPTIFEKKEPYVFLFPMGCLSGISAVLIWILFQRQWISFYPRAAHGDVMYFGLMWSFIAGFLMTAIPKMTSTWVARAWEVTLAIVLVILQIGLNFLDLVTWSVFLFAVQILLLISFVAWRFWIRKKVPFTGFIFLPIAFFQALLGVYFFCISGFENREAVTLFCGEAFVLNLIVGLGSRLVPVISRLPMALSVRQASKKEMWLIPSLIALTLNLGYWFQFAGFMRLAVLIKTFSLALAFIKLFKFFVIPAQWSVVGGSLKLALIFMMLGTVLNFPDFNSGLAGLHLLYIGGFALITFFISVRVTLAHGGQDLSYEMSSRRLVFVAGLFLLSAFLRFIAQTQVMGIMITLAAFFFVVAVGLWLKKFFNVLNLDK